VVAPDWIDPVNTSYSKRSGGRWNPAGEFGALYLSATIHVAAANARARHAGRAIKLFDLLPEARPEVVVLEVPALEVVDACSPGGVAALGFSESFPFGVPWMPCQAIARGAHSGGLPGVAARSNAEATVTASIGEELALFEEVAIRAPPTRLRFRDWYPDPIPG
jgi:RES domain-containing protein